MIELNYKYVNTEDLYQEMVEWLNTTNYFVFDVETGPRDEFINEWEKNPKIGLDPYRAKPYVIQVGTKKVQYLFDIRSGFSVDPILEALKNENKLKIGQNLRFDLKMMQVEYSVIAKNVSDTQIVEQVIRNGIFPTRGNQGGGGITRKFTSMASLAKHYLGIELDKDKDLRISLWKTPFNQYNKRQLDYMAGDCVYPDLIIRKQKPIVNERGLQATINLEHKLIPIVANMEVVGLPFDTSKWIALYQETVEKRTELEKELDAIFGIETVEQEDLFGDKKIIRKVNYDSTAQLAKLLNKKGIKGFVDVNGKSLSTKTSKIILGKLNGKIPENIADNIIEFRKLIKRESSYGKKFLEEINPVTKRIHPDFTQTILVTGRMSASPGVQTIPRDIRYRNCFIAPKGYKMIVIDASQIEPRLSVDLTGDEQGIHCFKNDLDIYKEDGQKFYNREIDKDTEEGKELRQRAKNAWLGLSYGQHKKKFHQWSMVQLNQKLERSETDFLFDRFFETHKTMKEGMDGWSSVANPEKSNRFFYDELAVKFLKKDRVYENTFSYYMDIWGSEQKAKKAAKFRSENLERVYYSESIIGRKRFFTVAALSTYTQARNAPIQSSAADIQKATVLAFQEMHWDEGYDADVVLVVHDEIITLVREDQAEELYEKQIKLGEELGSKFLTHIDLKWEGGVVDCWTKL